MRLFDTTFLVDLVNANSGAISMARRVDTENSPSAISAVSVYEYLLGVYFKHHKDDGKLRIKLASARNDLSRFEVLPLTQDIAEISSEMHVNLAERGQLIGINDVYIAATALHHKVNLVTRNKSHFARILGLQLESY